MAARQKRSFTQLFGGRSDEPHDDPHVREDGSQNFVEAPAEEEEPIITPSVTAPPPAPLVPESRPATRKRAAKGTVLATQPDSAVGERYARSRRGKKGVPLYLPPSAWRQLKKLALDEDVTMHDLMLDAVDELFSTHGLPRLARAVERPPRASSEEQQRDTR